MRDADEAETRAEQRDKSSGETSHKRVESSAETSAEQSRKEAQGAEVESRKGAKAKTGRVSCNEKEEGNTSGTAAGSDTTGI